MNYQITFKWLDKNCNMNYGHSYADNTRQTIQELSNLFKKYDIVEFMIEEFLQKSKEWKCLCLYDVIESKHESPIERLCPYSTMITGINSLTKRIERGYYDNIRQVK